MNIDKTIEAIDALPECETFVNSTTPHDGMVLFTDDLKTLAAELKELRRIIAFYGIEIMPDGSFTSPRITQNEVDLKELREFVGAMDRVLIDGHVIENQDGEWWVFRNDGEGIASGTDPADAWRKMKAEEGE